MKASELKAIVTGGASGLGLAVARRIVAEGGAVALLDLRRLVQTARSRTVGE